MFSVGLYRPDDTTMCRRRDTKSSDMVSCRPASIPFSRQKVHVIAEMAISTYIGLVILIPGGDPGDKRTVAFGASENSRPIGYLKSPVSVEMRD